MKYFMLLVVISFTACSGSKKISTVQSQSPANVSLNGKLFSALFMQRAAEYRALCYQAYNIARLRIDAHPRTGKPLAIITDIDETLLDNSPYAVHQAYAGKEYEPGSWYEWTGKGVADSLPGSVALLKYAADKNIEVFYITNREEKERASTLRNLVLFGFPNADEAHLMTKSTTSGKEQRRGKVLETHDVIFLMGDNMADFSTLFDKKNEEDRKVNTDISAARFGDKFIVLPNPNYGDWESSMYKNNYKLTQSLKDSTIKALLKSY